MPGLPISDVINVTTNITPIAAAARNLSNMLILGSTVNVIDTTERLRLYSSIDAVAADFGSAPEYKAALLYFEQSPRPGQVYIGFYAQGASAGRLLGDPLTTTEQTLANFTVVTNGSLKFAIDGSDVQELAIDLHTAANLNAVATLISTAFAGHATCVWNSVYSRFEFYSATTGATSSVSFSETPASGVDLAPTMGLRSTDGGRIAAGSAAETVLAGATACAAASNDWYALMSACVTPWTDAAHVIVAPFIEAATPPRIYGLTTAEAAAIDPTQTTDIASVLKAAGYQRSLVQYSNTTHAVASLLGRLLTVDFNGNNTAITLKFKNEPGVVAETLLESQAQALKAKNCNVFVNYNNATAIIQEGVMCNGMFIDERQISDEFANDLATAEYNALYLSPTKIPQTDAGVNQLVTVADSVCEQYVTNGSFAPGQWTGPAIGALLTGQTLAKGYYVYAPPVASQSPSDRAARKSPTLTVNAKLAGAIHTVNLTVNFNR